MQKFKQSWISLSMNVYTNWHLSWTWLSCSGEGVFFQLSLFVNLLLPPFAKWCGLSLPKTIFLLHLKFFFIYLDICLKFIQYAKRSAHSCLCTLKRTCDSDNRVPLPTPPLKNVIYILYRRFLGLLILVWHMTTKQCFLQVYSTNLFVKFECFIHFFLILQDSCKPLCHLKICKRHLSTYKYVLECFLPGLTEISPNQDNFHYFATIIHCNEMLSFLQKNMNHITWKCSMHKVDIVVDVSEKEMV